MTNIYYGDKISQKNLEGYSESGNIYLGTGRSATKVGVITKGSVYSISHGRKTKAGKCADGVVYSVNDEVIGTYENGKVFSYDGANSDLIGMYEGDDPASAAAFLVLLTKEDDEEEEESYAEYTTSASARSPKLYKAKDCLLKISDDRVDLMRGSDNSRTIPNSHIQDVRWQDKTLKIYTGALSCTNIEFQGQKELFRAYEDIRTRKGWSTEVKPRSGCLGFILKAFVVFLVLVFIFAERSGPSTTSSKPSGTSSTSSGSATTTTTTSTTYRSIVPLVWDLNIRKSASAKAESLGHAVQDKAYMILDTKVVDGYTWYKIGADQWIASKEGSWTRLTGGDEIDPIGFVIEHMGSAYTDWLDQYYPDGSTDDYWYKWTYEIDSKGVYTVKIILGDSTTTKTSDTVQLVYKDGKFEKIE